MFTYVRMKRKEYRVKLAVYTAIDNIIKEQEGITKLVTDLYIHSKMFRLMSFRQSLLQHLQR